MCSTRRSRLIDFITPWAEAQPAYRVHIGHTVAKFGCLTTDALEDLAHDICADFWRRKKLKREYAAHVTAAHVAEKMGYVVTDPYPEAAE